LELEQNRDGKWVPFTPEDVQFEAIMLDPYIRQTFTVKGSALITKFKLPDHYGVFTFKVAYKRHGLTEILQSETVQVRPFRHDQYPRFITVARPYYTNLFSLMAGFFVLSAVFLFNRENVEKVKTE
jgi:oligosaccharyltransferase complex subunit beta